MIYPLYNYLLDEVCTVMFLGLSDKQVWANSLDPDQTASRGAVTVCHSVCIFWTNYSVVKKYYSIF